MVLKQQGSYEGVGSGRPGHAHARIREDIMTIDRYFRGSVDSHELARHAYTRDQAGLGSCEEGAH